MKIIEYPDKILLAEVLKRPVIKNKKLEKIVLKIIDKVRKKGNSAILELTKKFDKVKLSELKVSESCELRVKILEK
ncbi:MAG: histidinol dehydrogenase [Bacteroidales bacterium]